jgi:hypothetical protein
MKQLIDFIDRLEVELWLTACEHARRGWAAFLRPCRRLAEGVVECFNNACELMADVATSLRCWPGEAQAGLTHWLRRRELRRRVLRQCPGWQECTLCGLWWPPDMIWRHCVCMWCAGFADVQHGLEALMAAVRGIETADSPKPPAMFPDHISRDGTGHWRRDGLYITQSPAGEVKVERRNNVGQNLWADRYGGNLPDPATVCPGPCEGIGVYPENDPSKWPPDTRPLGAFDEDGGPDDGWRFVTCPTCGGTGKRPAET